MCFHWCPPVSHHLLNKLHRLVDVGRAVLFSSPLLNLLSFFKVRRKLAVSGGRGDAASWCNDSDPSQCPGSRAQRPHRVLEPAPALLAAPSRPAPPAARFPQLPSSLPAPGFVSFLPMEVRELHRVTYSHDKH